LVRHGETAYNKEKRIQGSSSDIPLSKRGQLQAERLGLRLKDERIDAVYSSPLRRALDTAQAVAVHHQIQVTPLQGLKEINAGELEGLRITELKMGFDEFICSASGTQEILPIPGGESICDVQKRAWNVMQKIAGLHNEGTIVVVAHYFVILTIICQVLNMPLSNIVHLRLSTGTLTAFTMDEKSGPRLELFNDSCHNADLDILG
jgi:probable phosphoglycerate mutase